MMLTTKGRYAVMAMVDIACQISDNPVSLTDVATRQQINIDYLEQIFLKLRRNGLITSIRGAKGGYKLDKTPEEIKIADIIKAIEEPVKLLRCTNNEKEGCMKNKARCVTHHLWEGLDNLIHEYLQSVTLEQVKNNDFQGKSSLIWKM